MPKPTSIDIPLHDIKPLVEVPDNSLYILIGIIIGLLVAVVALIIFIRYLLARQKVNLREAQFDALKNVDFSNAKEAAYKISKYALFFKDDSVRHTEVYNNLSSRLSQYKYKKEIESHIDDETKGYYDIFVGMIDV